MHLLVVDDDPATRLLLSKVLSKAGYSVQLAADAEAALVHLQNGSFALLITDINLPGMNGHTLIGRARETQPDLPVIVMTSEGGFEAIRRSFEHKAQGFLGKPFEHVQLVVEKVERTLRLAETRATVDGSAPEPEKVG